MGDSADPPVVVTVAAPERTVWHALRDRQQIRQWHGWDYNDLDAEIETIYFDHATEDRHVLEVDGGDQFSLQPNPDGTAITLTRAPRTGDPEGDAYYRQVTEGWITFLQQLKFALERQPLATRRTHFYAAEADDFDRVLDELGLSAVRMQHPGTAYRTTILGEDAGGEIWFSSDNQLGVTVDPWGNAGLLIIANTPAASGVDAMAILSSYGLDEPSFRKLGERWTEWWSR
jgi:hypothetical protein